MRSRCEKPNHPRYSAYGAKGIKVCPEWQDFGVFLDWAEKMGHKDGMSIDLIDKNKNYEPDNCKWVPHGIRLKTRPGVLLVEVNGEKMSCGDLGKKVGLNGDTIFFRLKRGWSLDKAISIPPRKMSGPIFLNFNGSSKTVKEWSKELKIGVTTIRRRLSEGFSVEEALRPADQRYVRLRGGQGVSAN